VRNFRVDEPEIDQELNAALEFAFKEDKIILERIQQEQERDPNAKQITLGIDAAPRRMHKMVQKLIQEERQHLDTPANAGVAT
jgi:vanillate O-demethylase monooxygenase subunit